MGNRIYLLIGGIIFFVIFSAFVDSAWAKSASTVSRKDLKTTQTVKAGSDAGTETLKPEDSVIQRNTPEIVDLYIEMFRFDHSVTEVSPGGTLSMSYEIRNSGNTDALYTAEIYFTNLINDRSPEKRIHVNEESRGPRQVGLNRVTYNIPLSHPVGRWFVVLVVDPENKVRETNERNNEKFWPIDIVASDMRMSVSLPKLTSELTVDQLSISPSEATLGDTVEVAFRINNEGNTRISEVAYKIYIARSGNILSLDATGILLYTGTCLNLEIGSHWATRHTVTIPLNIEVSSSDFIAVWINSNRKVPEENMLDDIVFQPITLHGGTRPDLVVSRFEISPNPPGPVGSTFQLQYSIGNNGARESLPCTYRIVLKEYYRYTTWRDGLYHESRAWRTAYAQNHELRAIFPGQIIRFPPISFERQRDVEILECTITVDSGGAVIEADERNNQDTFRVPLH